MNTSLAFDTIKFYKVLVSDKTGIIARIPFFQVKIRLGLIKTVNDKLLFKYSFVIYLLYYIFKLFFKRQTDNFFCFNSYNLHLNASGSGELMCNYTLEKKLS